MSQQLNTDALDKLIAAAVEYEAQLTQDKNVLVNAANACDQAMGSDELSQRYITALNDSIEELGKAIVRVRNAIAKLKADLAQAESI